MSDENKGAVYAPEAWIRNAAENLIKSANNLGFKVTITLANDEPLAMGNHHEVIEIRALKANA